MFISESLMTEILHKGGIDGLIFLLLSEMAHLHKQHIRQNLFEQHKYGDLKKQLIMFTN